MSNRYQIGDTIRLSTKILTQSTKLPFDPAKVRIVVEQPDETLVTKTYPTDADVIKDSVGNYSFDLITDQSGVYHYVWRSINGSDVVISATDDTRVIVRSSRFAL